MDNEDHKLAKAVMQSRLRGDKDGERAARAALAPVVARLRAEIRTRHRRGR